MCNDYWTVDRIWINDTHGNFRAIDRQAIRHVCFSSMGVDFADIDRDGYLDLFVGGRVIPGRWPEPASSRIYRHEGGKFVLDIENNKVLEQVGLVSSAGPGIGRQGLW